MSGAVHGNFSTCQPLLTLGLSKRGSRNTHTRYPRIITQAPWLAVGRVRCGIIPAIDKPTDLNHPRIELGFEHGFSWVVEGRFRSISTNIQTGQAGRLQLWEG